MKTDYSGEKIKQKLKTNLFQEFSHTPKNVFITTKLVGPQTNISCACGTHTLDTRLKHRVFRAQTLSISNKDPNRTHQVQHLKTWCVCSLCDICVEEGIMFIHSLFLSDDAIIKIKILAKCKREREEEAQSIAQRQLI